MLWLWGEQNPDYRQETIREDCQLVLSTGSELEIRQYPGDDEMTTVALRDIDHWIMRRIVAGTSIGDAEPWASDPIAYSRN
jgi:hypothetical protein